MDVDWTDVGLFVASSPTTRDVYGSKYCTSISTTRASDYKPPMCPDRRFHSLECENGDTAFGMCFFECHGRNWQRLCVIGSHSNDSWLHWKIASVLPDGVGIVCWVCACLGGTRDSTWTTCAGKWVKKSGIKQLAFTGVHRRAVSAHLAHLGLGTMELVTPPVAQF